jgi:hypothetical protein
MCSRFTLALACVICGGIGSSVALCGQKSPAQPVQIGIPLPASLIALDTDEGRRQLWQSTANEDYISLSTYFTTQENQAFCSVATATMVLNSLPVTRPRLNTDGTYRLFTQDNFFTPDVCGIVSREKVAHSGMTLQQMAETLRTFPIRVEMSYAAEGSLDKFRAQAIRTLRDQKTLLVVNYLRRTLSQESGGHISPVAAYNQRTDRLLILDVARYKYPPVWVRAEALWNAMLSIDSESRKSRGYLIVGVVPDR